MAKVVLGTPDWSIWGDPKLNVWLWQAVLIAWNVEPRGNESLGVFEPDRWTTVRNGVPVPGADFKLYHLAQEVDRLLTIAVHSYGGSTSAFPTSPTPNDPRWRAVSLGEFGAWAVAQGWEVAEELPRFAPATVAQPSPAVTLPEPQRRLAALRSLGGDVKWSKGVWAITCIGKLVEQEKARGFKRNDEKTIRKDLREAAEAAKREGPSATPKASLFPT